MMVSFSEKLAAAKKVPRPYRDVTVALRADVAEKRAELEARLEEIRARMESAQDEFEAQPRLAAPAFDVSPFEAEFDQVRKDAETLAREEADSLVTLRFWELPGDAWTDLTIKNPPRIGVGLDMQSGFNVHAVAKAAAPVNGRVVEGDELLELTADEWADLWDQLAGNEFGNVCDVIYTLNEYAPQERVERLKKVSRLGPVDSPSSPE